jgi:hypothetical protein
MGTETEVQQAGGDQSQSQSQIQKLLIYGSTDNTWKLSDGLEIQMTRTGPMSSASPSNAFWTPSKRHQGDYK